MLSDFRYAARRLMAQRSTTLIAIGTLALGIGANTTVMTVVNAVLFKKMNVKNPEELVWISPRWPNGSRLTKWSYPDYKDFSENAKSYDGVLAFGSVDISLGGDSPERIRGIAASGNYFSVLGPPMAAGRGFAPDEDRVAGEKPVVVLSHGFWTRRFGGRQDVVGSTILLNGHTYTVIGVAAHGFNGAELGEPNDLWVPITQVKLIEPPEYNRVDSRFSNWLAVLARRKAGTSVETAQLESGAVYARIQEATRDSADDRQSVLVSAANGGVDPQNRAQAAPIMGLIMIVPILVLLVACANLANLLIARSLTRRKELAVRTALGASRSRLVKLMLAECLLLALAAAVVGSLASPWLTAGIAYLAKVPADVRLALVPDGTVFVATAVLAVLAGLLFGLVPALIATRRSLTPALKNAGVTFHVGRERHRVRNVFVVGQVAVSLTLLITAGLFVGSLTKALSVDPGFNPKNAVSVAYDLSAQGYTREQRPVFHQRMLDGLAATPGITAATIANTVPLSNRSMTTAIALEGSTDELARIDAFTVIATPGFFRTLEIPLVRGREFTTSDNATSTKVAVVNETLARQMWPGDEVIGKRFQYGGSLWTVVGIARNGRYRSLAEDRPVSSIFLPAAQGDVGADVSLVVRSNLTPAAAIEAIRKVAKSIEPNLPIYRVSSLEENVANTVDEQRAGAAMLGVFGGLGLLLAALGIFGVISQGVASRTKEIGIRMSLGARTVDVVRTFVREGIALSAVGAVIGVLFSIGISRLLTSLLFGLNATDVFTFALASGILALVATGASFIPARRAAKVDPLVALRSE